MEMSLVSWFFVTYVIILALFYVLILHSACCQEHYLDSCLDYSDITQLLHLLVLALLMVIRADLQVILPFSEYEVM